MTEDEYYALVDRLLEKEYGDGWVYVKEYLNILEEAEYRAGCGNAGRMLRRALTVRWTAIITRRTLTV